MTYSAKQLGKFVEKLLKGKLEFSGSYEEWDPDGTTMRPIAVFTPTEPRYSNWAILSSWQVAANQAVHRLTFQSRRKILLSPDEIVSAIKLLRAPEKSPFQAAIAGRIDGLIEYAGDFEYALQELERAAESRHMPIPPEGVVRAPVDRYTFKGL